MHCFFLSISRLDNAATLPLRHIKLTLSHIHFLLPSVHRSIIPPRRPSQTSQQVTVVVSSAGSSPSFLHEQRQDYQSSPLSNNSVVLTFQCIYPDVTGTPHQVKGNTYRRLVGKRSARRGNKLTHKASRTPTLRLLRNHAVDAGQTQLRGSRAKEKGSWSCAPSEAMAQ